MSFKAIVLEVSNLIKSPSEKSVVKEVLDPLTSNDPLEIVIVPLACVSPKVSGLPLCPTIFNHC